MTDGSITFSTALDNKELEKEYTATVKKIQRLTDKINATQARRSPAVDQSKAVAAELDAAKAQLDYMKSGQEFFTSGAVQRQSEAVKSIQKDWDKTQVAVEKYDSQIATANTELAASKEKAGAIASELSIAGANANAMGEATKKVNKHMTMFKSMLDRTIIRATSIMFIYKAIQSVFSYIGDVVKVTPEASKAVAQLKAALLTMAQPLVNVVIPALTAFIRILTQIIMAAARVFSILSGTTIEQSEKSAQALNAETNAIEGTSKAAKKASKSLAAFDEINQLSSADSSTSESAASSSSSSPDFSGLQKLSTADYKKKIDEITAIVSGALLALGAILFFTGAKPLLGLGLMALGAAGLAAEAKEHWNDISGSVQKELSAIALVLGGTLLSLGAILAFSGANVPLGIALMAAGAAVLITDAALNWDALKPQLQGSLAGVFAVISGSLLALGAILAFSGANIPLGIALMAVGAVGLVGIAALNWDSIKTVLQGPIGRVTATVSLALLAVGAILAFSGANLPLGIAMMTAGAVGLATAIVANWDTITTALKGPIGTIAVLVSGALLVLGAILTFSGANVPLGIAMLAAGGVGLVTALPINWDYILDKIKQAWANIQNWWDTNVSKYFTIEYWAGIGKNIVSGFLNGIKSIGTGAEDWGSEIIEDIRNVLGVHSPSTETESIGNYLVQGLINGINEHDPQLQATLQTVFNGMQKSYNEWQTNFLTGWGEFQTLFSGQWTTFWFNIHLSFVSQWNNILDTLQAGVNSAITALNELVAAANSLAALTGISYSSVPLVNVEKIPIPALATGAVIPPNREFMAVLGDQKSGTNIEAPLDTIVQAVMLALSKSNYGSSSGQVIENAVYLDGEVIYKNQKKISKVHGKNLAGK